MSKKIEIHTIVHFNDYELNTELQGALEAGDGYALLTHCEQWDFGGESEHSPVFADKPPRGHGAYDFIQWSIDGQNYYVLVYSSGFGDVTLYRCREGQDTHDEANN